MELRLRGQSSTTGSEQVCNLSLSLSLSLRLKGFRFHLHAAGRHALPCEALRPRRGMGRLRLLSSERVLPSGVLWLTPLGARRA